MPMFHGASSKIIFANLPSRSVRWFFGKFAREISEAGLGSDWESIKTNLRKIRKARVLVAVGEVDRDRVGIAAPVFGLNKILLGSVSLVFAQNEATRETVATSSALVFAAGEEIYAGLCTLRSNYAMSPQNHRAVESALPDVTESSWG
jgi:DNA-binding IclR family transcriptional regulator